MPPTVAHIMSCKGKKKLTQVNVADQYTARACELAGIEMLSASVLLLKQVRAAAPSCFITTATPRPPWQHMESDAEAIKAAAGVMNEGADAVYMFTDLDRVRAVARMNIPIFGHVGFVPWRRSWLGGARAVGKTAKEALQVYRETLAWQEAGAIGVELEVVPEKIATEISKRVDIFVVSMGSGPGCDAEYLFACDILGTHDGHYPRHSKKYRDHLQDSVAAFKEFRKDVDGGIFPAQENLVGIKDEEFEKFMEEID